MTKMDQKHKLNESAALSTGKNTGKGNIFVKNLSAGLKIAVSLGLMFMLFWMMRRDAAGVTSALLSCDFRYLALAVVVFIFTTWILAYRMKIIFLGEDLAITLNESFQLTLIGYFFNNFLPTAVGGDIVKAHCASLARGSRMRSYASVMMDRIIGLYSFLIFAAAALVVDNGRLNSASLKPLVFSFLVIGLAGFLVITNRKVAHLVEKLCARIKMGNIGEKIESVYKIVHDYKNRTDVVVRSLLVSLIAQGFYFVTIYMFFLALGIDIRIGNIFLVMPVVTFISMIPSVGGLGVRESAMVAFFAPVVGREGAFAASLLLLFGLFVVSFLGGIFYFFWSVKNRRDRREEEKKEMT